MGLFGFRTQAPFFLHASISLTAGKSTDKQAR